MKNEIALMAQALKIGTVPVELRKSRTGWRAFMPASITRNGRVDQTSHVEISYRPMSKTGLKMWLAQRYCAEVFEKTDGVYISPRYAMKCPRWGSRFGALPELTRFMKRAGLISV